MVEGSRNTGRPVACETKGTNREAAAVTPRCHAGPEPVPPTVGTSPDQGSASPCPTALFRSRFSFPRRLRRSARRSCQWRILSLSFIL